jgi:endonuclease YncB( thermonuclease family)
LTKIKYSFSKQFLLIILFLLTNINSSAHQGGLNSDECHNNNKTREYHCHKDNSERRKDGIRIVDGDTIHFDFGNRKVRFNGIDAPEIGQVCIGKEGSFDCGYKVREILKDFIGSELPICKSEDVDNYSRELAECFVSGNSISKYLVRSGYAFAYRRYSKKFIQDESYAKENNLGLWETEFEYPWDHRKKN